MDRAQQSLSSKLEEDNIKVTDFDLWSSHKLAYSVLNYKSTQRCP